MLNPFTNKNQSKKKKKKMNVKKSKAMFGTKQKLNDALQPSFSVNQREL